ncbi:DNA mismatch repair protein MSH4 [Canna indica]|uniref:DNA mismatch repair protein MSH4 n=1 Tax=Canna indica TaxID=4628 RepID=A0AAQ3QCB9_9LILI|nr:DNA mismatch repair protein MSH4 [Canna indica]
MKEECGGGGGEEDWLRRDERRRSKKRKEKKKKLPKPMEKSSGGGAELLHSQREEEKCLLSKGMPFGKCGGWGILALISKPTPSQVGLAAFDLRSASLHLSQYIETSCSCQNTKTLLHFYDPMVIIVPPVKLAADSMVGVSEVVDKHYASNKKVTFNGSFDHMNIDATSVQNLEIIEPLHYELWSTSNKKRSLFQMLKTTKTIGGARLLRANLLQPLKDVETINARLDCLDELMSNEELFFGLSQGLRKFPKETDKVLCRFCFKPKMVTEEALRPANSRKIQMLISDIIVLKTALDALPFLSKRCVALAPLPPVISLTVKATAKVIILDCFVSIISPNVRVERHPYHVCELFPEG